MKNKAPNISPFVLLLIPFLFTAVSFAGFSIKNEDKDAIVTALPSWEIPKTFQVKTLFCW